MSQVAGKDGVEVRAVGIEAGEDKRTRADFLALPYGLHRGAQGWVPPLRLERRIHFSAKNPYFANAEARFFVAYQAGRPVGRISAQIDRAYLARHEDATGQFGLFEAIDDGAVTNALLREAEDWLRARGMRRVMGPFSLSINDECGLLVHGFEHAPMLLMNYAPPFYSHRIEAAGYGKAKDLVAYDADVREPLPRAARALIDKAASGEARIALRPVDTRRLRDELTRIVAVFNDAWADNWGFVPFDEAEIGYMAESMKPIIRGDLAFIATVDGAPAGVIVCLPNINEAIADLDGRLLPLGALKLLWRLKVRGLSTARVVLMGVRAKYRASLLSSALAFMLVDRVRESALRAGIRRIELSWILEDNAPTRRLVEAIGGRHTKTYRIYEKALV